LFLFILAQDLKRHFYPYMARFKYFNNERGKEFFLQDLNTFLKKNLILLN